MGFEALLPIGAQILGSVLGANASSDAAQSAADAQTNAANAGIAQQNKQFEALQKLLAPYNAAGTNALGAQQNLIGLNGNDPQQAAINALMQGPQFTSSMDLGNRNILANASATGGLRGGNTQAALGQFGPQLLAQMIQQQYGNLGGLTSIGQNAAAGVGNAGMQTGNNISNLLGQIGSAQGGAALADGRATNNLINGVVGGFGQAFGNGGMSRPSNAGSSLQALFSGTGLGGSGFGNGFAYGNQDLGQYF